MKTMPQIEDPVGIFAEEVGITFQVLPNDRLWCEQDPWIHISLQAQGAIHQTAGYRDRRLPVDTHEVAVALGKHLKTCPEALGEEDHRQTVLAGCCSDTTHKG